MNNDLSDVIDSIKATVKMEDVIDMVGLGPVGRARKIRSLNGTDKTPSLHLYDYDWYDFSTGEGGDQITFVMKALDCSFGKAISILSRGASDGLQARRPTPAEPTSKPNMSDLWLSTFLEVANQDLTPAIAYIAKKWPYLNAVVDVWRTGTMAVESSLWTPHHSQDWTRITGIKVRDFGGGKRAIKGSTFTESLYRPSMKDTASAILVEGESDAWCMQRWVREKAPEWTVYGLPSGAGCWRPEFMNQLSNVHTLRICLDQDKAGLEAEQTIWMSLEDKIADIDKWVPSSGRVAESFAAGWEPT